MHALMGHVRAAADRYGMIEEGDRIAVGVSGGKDSLYLLYALAMMRRYYPKRYTVIALTADPCFGGAETDYGAVEALCREWDVEYRIRRTNLGKIIFEDRKEENPCSLCARMRRGILHDMAKDAGCGKIALGHHFDDVIETVLMSMLYGGEMKTMMPKVHSAHFAGMELIRPLYRVREQAVIGWARYNGLSFLRCACRLTEGTATGQLDSKRQEMKELIRALEHRSPSVGANIFHSFHNVNLGTLVGYRGDGVPHPFTEEYARPGSPYWLSGEDG